jgi:hypothetical protein
LEKVQKIQQRRKCTLFFFRLFVYQEK